MVPAFPYTTIGPVGESRTQRTEQVRHFWNSSLCVSLRTVLFTHSLTNSVMSVNQSFHGYRERCGADLGFR